MFITLTNMSSGFEELPIAINSDVIVAVFDSKTSDEEDAPIGTFIYSSKEQTWMVKESVNEVTKLLNKRSLK